MNIQTITKMLIDAGIEPNEAKKEIKMLLEHFCHYTELDRCKGVELSEKQLESLKEKAEKRANTKLPIQYIIGEAYFMGEFFNILICGFCFLGIDNMNVMILIETSIKLLRI